MTVKVAQQIALLVGPVELDLQATMNSGPDVMVEAKPATTLASAGWKEVAAGLRSFQWASQGFLEYGPNTVDEQLTLAAIAQTHPVTVLPDGQADGAVAYIANALILGTKIQPGPVGELHTYDLRAVGRDAGIARGLVLHPRATARTVSGTGVARQLGAVSATQRLWAALHVPAASGTTPSLTVRVQSDDNAGFTSPTDRITFTAAAGRTAQMSSVAGAITDQWWRVTWTVTGTTPSFRFSVAAGIT
jgi:hypothetical protein